VPLKNKPYQKNNLSRAIALLMTGGVLSISAQAADKNKAAPQDNSVFELGTMEVTDTRAPSGKLQSRDILSSVDILNADKIENQNVLTSYDLFHRMPGVQVTQFGQGTTTGKFSFRAFNGEGNINGVKLLIDGIPSNTNDGNMSFIDAIFPMDIESIEVVRGQTTRVMAYTPLQVTPQLTLMKAAIMRKRGSVMAALIHHKFNQA
jgi:outer membrane cobalamin receptor